MTESASILPRIISKNQRNWLIFGLVSIILRMILPESWLETVYSRGLYPWIRATLDTIHAWLPIHWFWVLIIGLLIIIVRYIMSLRKHSSSKKWVLLRLGSGLLTVLLGIAGLFLWLWGFNYGRSNFYQQINLEPVDLSLPEMDRLYKDQIIILENWRNQIPNQTSIIEPKRIADKNYNDILFALLAKLELAPTGNPGIKDMIPKGFLLRLGTSGFYNPLSGEANLDPALHPLQIPFVTAHELSHAYGITDEGACNFLAVLAGRKITVPAIRYAFELTFFRYISSQYRRMSKEQYASARKKLPASIAVDLKAIRDNGDLYPDFFPDFRDRTYELYLKTQGIQEGLGSYNRVVNMIAAWEKKNK